ncbi:hypothetical protein [Providencia sp. PROV079]|uniref:hypothetical protein n=1 Tax=Providencia sp. PROV079 TaxID=2949800 RepID=UPI00234AF26A|nr:hypothetical protein [Providencia sp. PROV079]
MSPYISGFLIFLIISLFLGAFFSLLYTDRLKLNDESLDKQPLFWFAVLSPIILFLIFGVIIWKDYIPDLSKAGLDKFAEISKFPLAVLALSPIFGVIVSNIHRTIQTEKQINTSIKQVEMATNQYNIAQTKNFSDSYYSHYKYIIDELNNIAVKDDRFKLELFISSKSDLYRKSFTKSSLITGGDYTVSPDFIQVLKVHVEQVGHLVKKACEDIDEKYIKNDDIFLNINDCLSHLSTSILQITLFLSIDICYCNKKNIVTTYLLERQKEINLDDKIVESIKKMNIFLDSNQLELLKLESFINEINTFCLLMFQIAGRIATLLNLDNEMSTVFLKNMREANQDLTLLISSIRNKLINNSNS